MKQTKETVKVDDVVTSTRGQKRGTVTQFSGDRTVVTVDFFDGTTKDFKTGNVKKAGECESKSFFNGFNVVGGE